MFKVPGALRAAGISTAVGVLEFEKTFNKILLSVHKYTGFGSIRGGTVGCGTTIQAGRWRVRFPMRSLKFFVDLILAGGGGGGG
jgi:hypothetical protein